MKIETLIGGFIGNMSIFPCNRESTTTHILRISEADLRYRKRLCVTAFIHLVRRLPAGFYTVVQHDAGYVLELHLPKSGPVRVRRPELSTINTAHQRPYLRVEVG
jgi:hypothetical protein